MISDNEFSQMINYLIAEDIISLPIESGSEI
jgi:hypothetical protein